MLAQTVGILSHAKFVSNWLRGWAVPNLEFFTTQGGQYMPMKVKFDMVQ